MSTEPSYEPTPEQIAEECRKIRESWTPEERQKRMRCDWRESAEKIQLQPTKVHKP